MEIACPINLDDEPARLPCWTILPSKSKVEEHRPPGLFNFLVLLTVMLG